MKTLALMMTVSLVSLNAIAQDYDPMMTPLPGQAFNFNSVLGKFSEISTKTIQADSTVPTPATPVAPKATCQTPKITDEHRKTPVEVYIDQEKQLMYVKRPKRAGKAAIFVTRISTGGGLKIPNGVNSTGRSPYCAKTPSFKNVIIPAIKESDFDTTKCTPDQIRSRATVFETYYTRTFSDPKTGEPIPMHKAMRLSGGIFLHQGPSNHALGENESGECIRMNPTVSSQLFEEMMIHGAIKVTVSEPPSHPCKNKCDQEMIDQAIKDIAAGKKPKTKRSSTDSGWAELFGMGCPNTRESTPDEARKVFERLAREEKQAQAKAAQKQSAKVSASESDKRTAVGRE